MPVRRLPAHPNLDHLKHQAKDLLRDHAARSVATAQRIREFHPRFARSTDADIFASALKLADAQLTIARESGFPSWPRLKRHIDQPTLTDRLDLPHHERIEDSSFRRVVDLIDAGDTVTLRAHLQQHPNLIHQQIAFEGWNYFHHPTLLEFVAENPVRRGKLPENICDVAKVILDAGPTDAAKNETLMLVATGSVARECGLQTTLINLLCERGADADSAAEPAALHHEVEALEALLRLGARVTLPIAAALGRIEDFRALLPKASVHDRHLALSVAADYGNVEIVRLLLDAGEDPNRYNPVGGHSHTTPLHQAAGAGHSEVVKLLVERGARLDRKDILWSGTPADWAHHAKHMEIENWLRSREILTKSEG
jgi:hypothetical protein